MQIVTMVLKITTLIPIPSFTDNLPLSFSFLCKLKIQMYVSIIHAILLTNMKSADLFNQFTTNTCQRTIVHL